MSWHFFLKSCKSACFSPVTTLPDGVYINFLGYTVPIATAKEQNKRGGQQEKKGQIINL